MMKLSLRGQLYAGFGLVVLIVAMMAVFAIVNGFRNAENFTHYRSAALASVASMDATTAVLEMRLEVKHFRAGLSDDPLPVMNAQLQVLYTIADRLDARGSAFVNEFRNKIALAESYKDAALRARDLQIELERVRLEDLFPSATQARETLTAINERIFADQNPEASYFATLATQQLLLARTYTNRFFATGDEIYLTRVYSELNALDESVEIFQPAMTTPAQRALVGEVEANIETYRVTMAKVAQMASDIQFIYASELQIIGDGIMAAAVDLAEAQRGLQDTIGPALHASFAAQKVTTFVVASGGIALAIVLGIVLARTISHPVLGLTQVMRRLRERDYSVEIPATERGDEIGSMARAVDVFKAGMMESDRLKAEQQAEQAKRLERAAAVDAAIAEFEGVSEEALDAVLTAAGAMHQSSETLSSMADEANAQSQAVASASEEASMNVQTVAGAAEELSASIAEIGQQVAHAADMSQEAVGAAQSTREEVRSLAQTADKIGEVVSLIRDIAEQTNLLALNATIEAARAGDAGKGFAVVATEVKALAEQTAKATEQISGQVGAIQSATADSVESIHSISEKITAMDEVSAAIAAAVEEQGSATQDIARSVQQVAEGTDEVSRNIHGVREAAEETGSSSTHVFQSSVVVNDKAEVMRHGIETFLDKIRAA